MRRYLLFNLVLLCCIKSNAQIVEKPVFDRMDTPAFRVEKVEMTSDTTFIYCSYFANANSWANISNDMYLISYPSKKKYKILSSSGLPYAPDKRVFPYSESCQVLLCFPSIKGANSFDLIENIDEKAFNVFGVSLVEQIGKNYHERDFARLYNMSSFYETSGDTLKAIQFKKEEIEAAKYLFGIQSDVTFFSFVDLCVLLDKYGFTRETLNLLKFLSKLKADAWAGKSLEFIVPKRLTSDNFFLAEYYDKVIKTIHEALPLYERLHIIDNSYALILRYNAYYNTIDDEERFVLEQKRCLDIRRQLGDQNSFLEDLFLLFISKSNANLYVKRLGLVDKEIDALPKFVDKQSLDYAYFLSFVAPMYRMTNNPQKSISVLNEILKVFGKNNYGNTIKISEVQEEKLKCLIELEMWDEALEFGEKARIFCDSMHVKNESYTKILFGLANSYSNKYDYEKAIPIMMDLVSIQKENEDWFGVTSSLCHIGNYYKDMGKISEAKTYLEKSLDIINSHDKAEEYLEKEILQTPEAYSDSNFVLKRYKDLNDMIMNHKAAIYASLGFVSSREDNYAYAIECELKAGELMKKNLDGYTEDNLIDRKDFVIFAAHLLSLSSYYAWNGEYDNSIKCTKESIEFFKKGGHSDYNTAYCQLAKCNIFIDLDSALYYANKAYEISNLYENTKGIQNSLTLLAFIYKLKKDYNQAEEFLSRVLSNMQNTIKSEMTIMTNEQKQRFWNQIGFYFLSYRDIVSKCDWSGNLISKLLNYTIFSKGLLLETDLKNAEQAYCRMGIVWTDIQKKMSNNDIVIDFITTQDDSDTRTYHALVIDNRCEYPNMITLFKESDLEKLSHIDTKFDLEQLGNYIWKPILDQYEQVENIYFSPDGILHKLPIEFCYVAGIGDMMEQYNMYRLSSIKEILFQNSVKPNTNAVLYGGLDYDMLAKESMNDNEGKEYSLFRSINDRGGFEPLSSTLDEVDEIRNLLLGQKVSTSLYTGKDGTEETFVNLSGKDVNILHLSTHGMYVGPNSLKQKKLENNFDFLELITNEKDPVKEDIVLTHSFLVMSGGNKHAQSEIIGTGESDGILTASEISYVDLSKVDIVVLSACESGLGDLENDGVYGLQRGFKKAGVKTILMSLDKVDDEATKIIMVEFYRNLMNGKTKLQSLQNAQQYLRKVENGKYDEPKYWASFIMLDGFN